LHGGSVGPQERAGFFARVSFSKNNPPRGAWFIAGIALNRVLGLSFKG
jgi:hypothetical protein